MYPEREEAHPGGTDWVSAFMDKWLTFRKPIHWKRFKWIVAAAAGHADEVSQLSDQRIQAEAADLGRDIFRHGLEREPVARVFALVREVAERTLGMRHLDVQLVGGLAMLHGLVAEMETGEGKTLTATLPACCMALSGTAVHVITVNDYLANRDAEWMKPIYAGMGLTVGTVLHGMPPVERRAAYRCHVTYCTNKELAFDYLRDRIVLWDRPSALRMQMERLYGPHSRTNQLLLQGLQYAIVDEADSVLVDEARTPLIISAEADGFYNPGVYRQVLATAQKLERDKDFSITGERTVELNSRGKERIVNSVWTDLGHPLNPISRLGEPARAGFRHGRKER